MTRLTKRIKAQIVQNALTKANHTEDVNSLRRRTAELAEAVRVIGWSGHAALAKLEADIEVINALIRPLSDKCAIKEQYPGFREDTVAVAFGGLRTILDYCSPSDEGAVYKYTAPGTVMLPADHPLSKEFEHIETERQRLQEVDEEIKAQTFAALNSFTTIKKLLAGWPEAAELLPPEERPTCTGVAVRTDELNKLIGS